MKESFRASSNVVKFVVVAVALVVWPAIGQAQNTFSGQATAVGATVAGVQTVISGTGALSSAGDALAADLVGASVPGTVSVDNAHAAIIGLVNETDSEASDADLAVTVGGNTISADFLMATASASCSSGVALTAGSADVENLVINGLSVQVTGSANQVVSLPLGSVTINEQSGSPGSIQVNALHIRIPGVADAVIGSANSGIGCGSVSLF